MSPEKDLEANARPQPGSSGSDTEEQQHRDADRPARIREKSTTTTTPAQLPRLSSSSSSGHVSPPAPPACIPEDRPYSVFTLWEKRAIMLAASLAALFSPITGQIYLPAMTDLATDLHVTEAQINLTVSTYMIFQGITPMFIGSLADTAGRRPAFAICFIIYIGANIGLALSRNYTSLLVVRMLQSAGSATTVALCQAVMADIITSSERGRYIGFTVMPVVLAPSLGPVLGGILTMYLGWRSIFWFLAIAAGVMLFVLALFFPETCRNIVDDGSRKPPRAYRTVWQLTKETYNRRRERKSASASPSSLERTASSSSSARFTCAMPNLLVSFRIMFELEVGLILYQSAVAMAGFYAICTAMPAQLAATYGFSSLQIGFMYLPVAAGSAFSALLMGRLIDRNYRRHAARLGIAIDAARQMDLYDFPIERVRLEIAMPSLAMMGAVTVCWGWVMQTGPHLAGPIVLLFVFGCCLTGVSNPNNALIVDCSPGQAGAAVAANNITRCLLGAVAAGVIQLMIGGIGSGWSFVIIGALIWSAVPIMIILMRWGMTWRQRKVDRQRQRARAS